MKDQGYIKSDERIFGESYFATGVISKANEAFERRYELKRQGYDLGRIAERVAELYEIERDAIFLKDKQQRRVKARSLFCYWAVRELGVSLTELARRLNMSVPAVGYSVDRGEIIADKNDLRLIK